MQRSRSAVSETVTTPNLLTSHNTSHTKLIYINIFPLFKRPHLEAGTLCGRVNHFAADTRGHTLSHARQMTGL